jgi:hypothetical protein
MVAESPLLVETALEEDFSIMAFLWFSPFGTKTKRGGETIQLVLLTHLVSPQGGWSQWPVAPPDKCIRKDLEP